VFLAVIGPNWLDQKDAGGRRRIEDPHDFVTIEIAAALQREIRVIPVLIDGANLPRSEDLPEPLKPLVRRHAVEVRNAQFGRDAEALAQKVHEALKSQRPVRRRWPAIVAGTLALLLSAGGIAVYQGGVPSWILRSLGASSPTNALHDALLARTAAYSIAEGDRKRDVQRYESESVHKALAVSPEAHATWWSSRWPTAVEAETGALEGCQLQYGKPCALIATDDKIVPESDILRVRDMPRAHYSGAFDLQQIPKARLELLKRTDVANYASAPKPKAAAFHPEGLPTFETITNAPSQFEAEEQALAKCNAAPKVSGGLCFLYAVADQVVLPQRLTKPVTPRQGPR
jgi:hypothetical protein